MGVSGPQKLKQFADIIYIFWLQKRSKFENFAQLTVWFLTSMFPVGLCDILGARPPLAHTCRRHWCEAPWSWKHFRFQTCKGDENLSTFYLVICKLFTYHRSAALIRVIARMTYHNLIMYGTVNNSNHFLLMSSAMSTSSSMPCTSKLWGWLRSWEA